MGCAFSRRNGVRVPRVFKRKKVSRSRKNLNSTPLKFSWDVSTQTEHDYSRCSTCSVRPATLNTNTAEWYTPDVAPSTLLWLVGPKDCLEDSIPELANINDQRNANEEQNRDKGNELILPACLVYEGYHEYGFHLFTLNSSVFNSTVQDMSLDCIPNAIATILSDDDDDKPLVLVYKNSNNQITYLPNPPAWGKDLLDRICTLFGDQLLRVVLYRPSWYLHTVLDEQTENGYYFSSAVTEKLRVTSDFKELARLTGFPGEIKKKSP